MVGFWFRPVSQWASVFLDKLNKPNVNRFGLFSGMLFVGISGSPALAQLTPEIQIMLLETQLGACYSAPTNQASASDMVEINLEIDADGILVGEPIKVASETNTAGQQAILRAATTAMGACLSSGSESDGETSVFTTTFGVDGISVVLATETTAVFVANAIDDAASVEIEAAQASDVAKGEMTASQRAQLEVVRSAGYASSQDEAGLGLETSGRREIQAWLEALGFDTQKESGVFGEGTRDAIYQWQANQRVVASGFLNREQAVFLEQLALETADDSPWELADHEGEKTLNLNRAARAEIQARLGLLGFDPNGIDGVFGRGSRTAISAWQQSESIPESGFFDERQINRLNSTSEDMFTLWLLNDTNKNLLTRASRAPARPRVSTRWWRDSSGRYCRRTLLGTWCQANRPRNP